MADNMDLIKTLGPLIIMLKEDPGAQTEMLDKFQNNISDLEKAIQDARTKGDQDKRLTALSKGLPTISKGVIEAVNAFRKNDPFAGSAAVIDVTSAMITTVAGIAGAAGPPGMLVGSLLSVLSMILKIFSDQKPAKSLQKQLDEVIRNYDSEKKIQELTAAQGLIDNFIQNVSKDKLEPLTYSEVLETYAEAAGTNLRLMIMKAAKWLKERKNQELELWDSVLAAQCLTFISYNQSMLMTLKIAKTEEDVKKINDYLVKSFHSLQLNFLNEIIEVARNRGTIWASHHGRLSSRRYAVVSDSNRDWQYSGKTASSNYSFLSLSVTTRTMNTNSDLHTSNPFYVQFSIENVFERLRLPGGWQKEWTQEKYEQQKNYPFQQKNLKSNSLNCRLGKPPFKENNYHGYKLKTQDKNGLPPASDVWALPGFRTNTVFVYTANQDRINVWEHGSPNLTAESNKYLFLRRGIGLPDGYNVGAVRAVFPEAVPGDSQDEFSISGDSSDFLNVINPLIGNVDSKEHLTKAIYGACEVSSGKSIITGINASEKGKDHMEISAHFLDFPKSNYHERTKTIVEGSIMSPWQNFVGIAVDKNYLWVYRAGAIACTSHSSVKHCLEGQLEKPIWMVYNIQPEVINERPYDPESVGYAISDDYDHIYFRRGLVYLHACDDGTLTAAYSNGLYADKYVYLLTPQINPNAKNPQKRLVMKGDTNAWRSDKTIKADFVVKQPIFCWSLIAGLKAVLEKYS